MHGERGSVLTAYRNCVLADLFYGAGIVDKVGSGLADALEAMEASGGHLRVEVAEDNTTFSVTLTRRSARIDTLTQTAQPTRPVIQFHTNILEVLSLPATLWSAPTVLRKAPDPKVSPEARDWPRFVCYDSSMYTFADLTHLENPLRPMVTDDAIRQLSVTELASNANGERRLVHLLHEILFHHLSRQGLRVDWRRKRAYFTCPLDRQPVRHKQYRARLRQSRRRVAKWERSYCVHDAAVFRFERYAHTWALLITPTYVFTRDGVKDFIDGSECSVPRKLDGPIR